MSLRAITDANNADIYIYGTDDNSHTVDFTYLDEENTQKTVDVYYEYTG